MSFDEIKMVRYLFENLINLFIVQNCWVSCVPPILRNISCKIDLKLIYSGTEFMHIYLKVMYVNPKIIPLKIWIIYVCVFLNYNFLGCVRHAVIFNEPRNLFIENLFEINSIGRRRRRKIRIKITREYFGCSVNLW